MGRESRVATCGVIPQPGRQVTIKRKEGGLCYYDGVTCCGSVWLCPVCTVKISRGRADELRQGITSWRAGGGVCTMFALTVRHGRQDKLESLLGAMSEAQRWMFSGRWWQDAKASWGVAGMVRNLECTWGHKTGWHPHSHVLVFSERPLDKRALYERWARAAEKFGLLTNWASWTGGCVDTTANVSDYLAKLFATDDEGAWTAGEELTMHHYKTSKMRYTPFDLLRGLVETGEAVFADRFREYAAAYAGKRQLWWSKGLRDRLGLASVEVSDDDLANADDEGGEVLATIDSQLWRYICNLGLRLDLLHAVEEFGVGVVTEFFEYVYHRRRALEA